MPKSGITALFAVVIVVVGCFSEVFSQAKFHIGIVTGTVSQSEDDLRGAEAMIKEYGEVKTGGMIQHVTYPVNFMNEQETTISQIVGLANDPLMKAIVMNQAVPGATEGFRRVRETRLDILLLAGVPQEDPIVISSVADLVMRNDFVSAGYRIVWTAKQLGAKNFVHISFPRHMSIETLTRRRMIMEAACKDLGLAFIFETAPDPTSDIGIVGAQQFMLEKVPQWVKKYGKETAFYATNDAHTEPLIKQIATYGGIFVEASLPSPLLGYPGALGIDLKEEKGNFPAIMKKVEKTVVDKGGKDRFGTWAFSFGYSATVGLTEHAKRVIEGKSKMLNLVDIFSAFGKYTPGSRWGGAWYVDASTGVKLKNFALLLQDTYIFGKGFMKSAEIEVPEKYLKISSGLKAQK